MMIQRQSFYQREAYRFDYDLHICLQYDCLLDFCCEELPPFLVHFTTYKICFVFYALQVLVPQLIRIESYLCLSHFDCYVIK